MTESADEPADEPPRRPLTLLRDPEFAALASVRFVSGMAFATIIIALALYADLYDASGFVAGLFGSAYAVVRLVLVMPLGRKIDLGNSKRYLLIGLGLLVALFAGFLLVESIAHVVYLRGFQALGSIVLWVTGVAVVGEIAPDDGRALWIGTYNQVRSIASLLGDIVGGALLFLYGFQTTWTVMIALACVSLFAVWWFLRDDPGTRADPEEATGVETVVTLLKRRTVFALVVFRFAFSFGKMAVIIFLPIFARTAFDMNALLIGGILAGGKLTKGLLQGRIGAYADRAGGSGRFIVIGTVGYAAGTALIPAASAVSDASPLLSTAVLGHAIAIGPPFVVLFVSYAILGVADSFRLPTSMALFVEEGEHFDAVAGSLSLRSVSWQVGAIVGPLAVGGTLDYVSVTAGFWLAAAFMLVAGGLFVWLYDGENEPAPVDGAAVGND